ncbi:efflux RND transporter permease subunit [Aestuariibius sp. 2305UL40-4]|uniref:efflux RND transporter permease subunit n=1 Tax=Aestuariibius violaceus TaxID=3234132 RepID=UPI00345E10FF
MNLATLVIALGLLVDAAIVEAAKRRLRPIILTAVTTILGLLPLILSNDPLFYGMAVVMAGGLVVGTVLTLGFVPVLYSVFFSRPRRAAQTEEVKMATA